MNRHRQPAPNGVLAEVQRASRGAHHLDISLRFTDLSDPIGWAYLLLDGQRLQCAESCAASPQ